MAILNEHLKDESRELVSSELATEITAGIWSVSKYSNYVNLTDSEIMTVIDSKVGNDFIDAISELILNKGGES